MESTFNLQSEYSVDSNQFLLIFFLHFISTTMSAGTNVSFYISEWIWISRKHMLIAIIRPPIIIIIHHFKRRAWHTTWWIEFGTFFIRNDDHWILVHTKEFPAFPIGCQMESFLNIRGISLNVVSHSLSLLIQKFFCIKSMNLLPFPLLQWLWY